MTASPLPAETRALIRALLEHHTTTDTCALVNRSLSGVQVMMRQVTQINWRMKNPNRDYSVQPPQPPAPPQPIPVAKPPKPPLTFEEKLARVAAGARLVPTFTYRRVDPTHSLVGNGTAMCS